MQLDESVHVSGYLNCFQPFSTFFQALGCSLTNRVGRERAWSGYATRPARWLGGVWYYIRQWLLLLMFSVVVYVHVHVECRRHLLATFIYLKHHHDIHAAIEDTSYTCTLISLDVDCLYTHHQTEHITVSNKSPHKPYRLYPNAKNLTGSQATAYSMRISDGKLT